jgi:hypothetical protein
MSRRVVSVLFVFFALLFGQAAALAHDIGHFDAQAPASVDCDSHFAASQMGGGPLATLPSVAVDLAAAPADSRLRQRDASIPVRVAYLSQAPPSTLR